MRVILVANETNNQSKVRIAASSLGWVLFRNNVGVLKDLRGVPVRFGLANDSKQVNKNLKSGDLIGIRPVLITQEMVGTVIGQFVSYECKRTGWVLDLNDPHTNAQQNWADLINRLGGYAKFTTGDL